MLTLIRTAYFQDFVESLVNGVLIFNTSGQVYVANDAAANIIGYSCESLLNMTLQQVFKNLDDTAAMEDMLTKARAKEQRTPSFQTRLKQETGEVRHLNISASLLIEYEKVFGILVLMTDVTHIVQLHEREKEILEERNRLAKERFASLQNLAAAVAHQIRNPVMTIGGFAHLLQKKAREDAGLSEYLDAILASGRRLEDIVQAMSDYNALQVNARQHEVKAVLADCTQRLEQSGPGRDLALEVRADDATLHLDKELLCSAVQEIVTNALEAQTARPVHIRIRGIRGETRYSLEILDNGPGLPDQVLPYAKDPFFTTKAVGVGMGLTRAEKIIGDHHGRLTLQNADGGGALAIITLPLQELAPPAPSHSKD